MRRTLESESNRAYRGQREDGWKAEDKLSFRQQSKMCVGGKDALCCERTVDKGADRQVKVENKDKLQEIAWEKQGENDWREDGRGKGKRGRKERG